MRTLNTVTPNLIVKEARKAIEFYKKAFDAKELKRGDTPDGRVMYAFLQIGNSIIAISDAFTGEQACGTDFPSTLKGISMLLYICVEDVDVTFNQAVQAGAEVVMPVKEQFWGVRYGQLDDPFGHRWAISAPMTLIAS